MAKTDPDASEVVSFLHRNAELLWDRGKGADGTLFGTDWSRPPAGIVQLSSQLSGIKLLEQMAELGGIAGK
ncbi:hypothetical protein D3C80_1904210 [compost metagenome]